MGRSRRSQSAHNAKVKSEARKLERSGHKVRADVKGYEKPKTLGGYRPDIVAKKGAARKIIEVETPDSAQTARDQAQQRAFRRAADRSDGTTFRRVIADD